MATTIRRILIDENGSARVFYVRDDGPSGSSTVELKDTSELKALLSLLQKSTAKKIEDASTPEGRDAARAARIARVATRPR